MMRYWGITRPDASRSLFLWEDTFDEGRIRAPAPAHTCSVPGKVAVSPAFADIAAVGVRGRRPNLTRARDPIGPGKAWYAVIRWVIGIRGDGGLGFKHGGQPHTQIPAGLDVADIPAAIAIATGIKAPVLEP